MTIAAATLTVQSACLADIAPPGPPTGNGVVNIDDLLAVINGWGGVSVIGKSRAVTAAFSGHIGAKPPGWPPLDMNPSLK
jgi:hypothetical protein